MAIMVGHSADPDDAFMVWALAAGEVDTRGLELEPLASDIETLNRWALEGRLEVTAVSAGVYPEIADRYLISPHGASFGEGYGPVVVARDHMSLETLRASRVAIPGRFTTAYLLLRLALGGDVRAADDFPFDAIMAEVGSGNYDAGLLIHEGQLTYADAGLVKVVDLGEWWRDETSLPLPLGLVAVRRDLERSRDVVRVLRDAIDRGLEHRSEALEYALRFGRGVDRATADTFVSMYVTDLTRDMGQRGRTAVIELMRRADAAGAPEFADA